MKNLGEKLFNFCAIGAEVYLGYKTIKVGCSLFKTAIENVKDLISKSEKK